jgi:hypothetical protein
MRLIAHTARPDPLAKTPRQSSILSERTVSNNVTTEITVDME